MILHATLMIMLFPLVTVFRGMKLMEVMSCVVTFKL